MNDTLLRQLRRVRAVVGRSSRLVGLVQATTPLGTRWQITPTTDLVIEGFPRSGNTFARFAVLHAQPDPIEISSHAHVPGQIHLAIRHGLPTLVVIRTPAEVVASNLVFAPHAHPKQVLREWLGYHRSLARHLDRIVLADFSEVIRDMGAVTRRVNERFGTDFAAFEASPEAVGGVFEDIARHHGLIYADTERTLPLPSVKRDEALAEATERLRAPELERLMRKAEDRYLSLSRLDS